jgi:hypothetical protein
MQKSRLPCRQRKKVFKFCTCQDLKIKSLYRILDCFLALAKPLCCLPTIGSLQKKQQKTILFVNKTFVRQSDKDSHLSHIK